MTAFFVNCIITYYLFIYRYLINNKCILYHSILFISRDSLTILEEDYLFRLFNLDGFLLDVEASKRCLRTTKYVGGQYFRSFNRIA